MRSRSLYSTLLTVIIFLICGKGTKAQLGQDPDNYTYLTYQLGTNKSQPGTKSGIMPSVASYNGYQSFLQNPAVMGLANKSEFAFSFINSNVSEESSYLGGITNANNNLFRLNELSLVYAVPTYQGSFVIGGGYTITDLYNRIDQARGFNERSSLTDYFVDPGSGFEDFAFETYTGDFATSSSDNLTSIFRLTGPYQGLAQDFLRRQTGRAGNYNIFLSTEFARGLFFGASLGYSYGQHVYNADLIESDEGNNYSRSLIPSDQANTFTDVDFIEFEEELTSTFTGLDLRGGVMYDAGFVRLGASVYIPFTLRVEEDFYAFLQNNLDDGSAPFFCETGTCGSEEGIFQYRISRPREYTFGLSTGRFFGFSGSASARVRDNSDLEVDFVSDFSGGGVDRVALNIQADNVNEQINELYKQTVDYRFGLSYQVNENSEIYGSYAYQPSPVRNFNALRTAFGAGADYKFNDEWSISFAGQYWVWNDRSIVYEFGSNNQGVTEETSLRTGLFHFTAGIRYSFR